MIPKVIHYCWFGGNPLPDSAKKCISSWRKYLPDYEIKEWNERNFDVKSIPYTREAYRLKKFAFVSDYARMWILYHYGGIYFDTDVEVIKPFNDIIQRGNFMGFEAQHNNLLGSSRATPPQRQLINPGLGLGIEPHSKLIKKILKWYQTHHFVTWKGGIGTTVVYVVSSILNKMPMTELGQGICKIDDVYVYPADFFCPKNYASGKIIITENTRSIHHYSSTWVKSMSMIEKNKERLKFISARLNLPFMN